MPFRVTARTVLQLGAELISSDGIAFYELIKNAFDAKSKRVQIEVVVRIPADRQQTIRAEMREIEAARKPRGSQIVERFKGLIAKSIDVTAPHSHELRSETEQAASWQDVWNCLEEANHILFRDTGEGMSLNDLQEVFLTIGTRARLKDRIRSQQEQSSGDGGRPILGEKGLGRLSTMRLGNRLKVITGKSGEERWNELSINWNEFSNDSDQLIEQIPIQPRLGPMKESTKASGTTLRITALIDGWSKDKLLAIARQEFSKLTDPFTPSMSFPIAIRFNGEVVPIPPFDKLLLEHAHAVVRAEFRAQENSGEFTLAGTVEYRNRKQSFHVRQIDLLSAAQIKGSPDVLKSLGPFSVEAYWYNRRILKEIEGIGDLQQVRSLVKQWGGGLMLFRDGFRVNPYGNLDDDWLELDPKAFSATGYKVNRRQIIGKVDISSRNNPTLVDQTNREGLRDCAEKRALVNLLQHILEVHLRRFLNKVDEEYRNKERLDFDQIEDRVRNEEIEIRESLKSLRIKYPRIDKDTKIISSIEQAIRRIDSLMEEAKELAESFERRHSELVNLAGLGLIVEVIAHELNRATLHTLSTIADTEKRLLPPDLRSVFSTLENQLKTLQKRLRVLDPLSTAGRQRKENFDLVSWVKEALDSHAVQFQRHGIVCEFKVRPKQASLQVHAVKGMIIQILENLISNSVYWLKQQKRLQFDFDPKIVVTVNVPEKSVEFTDNGPGIEPERKEEIFEAFVTTKPPREGKGLGLFISREIARYNGAHLYLSDSATVHQDTLNTFVLELQAGERE